MGGLHRESVVHYNRIGKSMQSRGGVGGTTDVEPTSSYTKRSSGLRKRGRKIKRDNPIGRRPGKESIRGKTRYFLRVEGQKATGKKATADL